LIPPVRVASTRVAAAVACTVLCCLTAVSGDDAGDILKKLERKYDSIKDIVVSFREQVHYGVTGSEQSFAGTMWMKKGNRYRIELEGQTIVTDGSSVWSYSKANNQVIIDRYKESPDSFSPDKILANAPSRFTAIILGKEQIEHADATILKLTPKEKKSRLQWMKVWVNEDDVIMKKIQLLDISDNLTTYLVGEIRFDGGIDEKQFVYDPPAGAEVVDLR